MKVEEGTTEQSGRRENMKLIHTRDRVVIKDGQCTPMEGVRQYDFRTAPGFKRRVVLLESIGFSTIPSWLPRPVRPGKQAR